LLIKILRGKYGLKIFIDTITTKEKCIL